MGRGTTSQSRRRHGVIHPEILVTIPTAPFRAFDEEEQAIMKCHQPKQKSLLVVAEIL